MKQTRAALTSSHVVDPVSIVPAKWGTTGAAASAADAAASVGEASCASRGLLVTPAMTNAATNSPRRARLHKDINIACTPGQKGKVLVSLLFGRRREKEDS
jgi:hypothetical protein